MHPALTLRFERAVNECAQWHAVPAEDRSFQSVACMTADASGHHFAKGAESGLQLACNADILCFDGETTRGLVHLHPGILHALRHVFGDLCPAMQPE